jgi:hypothetical protein
MHRDFTTVPNEYTHELCFILVTELEVERVCESLAGN